MGKLILWLHLLPWVKGLKVDSLIILISLAKVTTISISVINDILIQLTRPGKNVEGDVLIKFTEVSKHDGKLIL